MISRWLALAGLVPLFAAVAPAGAAEGDVPGSADHPLIGRFEGSVISGYDARDFDEYRFVTGPGGEDAEGGNIEGRVTRIAYRTGPGPSIAEVARNLRLAFEAADMEIVFACTDDDCGGTAFAYAMDTLPIPQMNFDSFNYRYIAGRLGNPGTTYATAFVSQNNNEIYAQVTVVEVEALQNRIISAEELASGLAEAGHIALYGVYFETDSARLREDSRPTLDEMGALLAGDPGLEVIVVGHTDSQGGLDYNMDLSRRRAEAVAADLTANYGIDAGRLGAAGVGYLAPVGSNATEAGRALNRRVELVAP